MTIMNRIFFPFLLNIEIALMYPDRSAVILRLAFVQHSMHVTVL